MLKNELKALDPFVGRILLSPKCVGCAKGEGSAVYVVAQIGKDTFNTVPSSTAVWGDENFEL